MSLMKFMNSMKVPYKLFLALVLLLLCATYSYAATPAGYSEYYIPGDENIMGQVWADIGAVNRGNPCGSINTNATRHTLINVVAWSPNTTIYYDHWENGYNFDPDNPDATADEKYVLANAGDSKILESFNIPVNPRGTATYYDGRDRIYVAGGVVTITRASWIDVDINNSGVLDPTNCSIGTVFSLAWEVYPVKPQMTTYILPFGDDLAVAPRNYLDFRRVFALVQATKDNTVVTFDFNKDGVFGDTVCVSHNNPCTQTATQVTLNAGEVFLVDRYAPYPTTGTVSLPTGTVIQGTETLQVNYIVGDQNETYEARGFSAFPSGMWDNKYYAPVPSDNGLNYPTQIYLYNPQSTALTINYETSSSSGSFSVPAGQTRSFSEMTGGSVPAGSGVYLKASDVFWGVSTIDTGGPTHEWGYPLVPSFLLGNEHFFGWAPGAYVATPPIPAGDYDDSGIFITPVQDNTRVYVDTNHDGTPDQSYTLNRLQTQYVYDSSDGDMSNSNIWATGPIAIAYGQNADTAPPGTPAIDLGYVSFPGGDFIDKVLTVKKSANPVVVSTTSGSTSTYTLVINSYHFDVSGVTVTDTLPSGWQYVNNSTTITLADKTTIAANPTITGGGLILTWPSSTLGNVAPNQTITITFQAHTTQSFTLGAITRNIVQASGTRTVAGATQTFVASDFAFNSYGDLTVSKTSSATDPLYPGSQFTYTVTVTNPSAETLTGVSVYDPLPDGVSYVASSAQVTTPVRSNVRDNFGTRAYNHNDGSVNWAGNWIESDSSQSATAGNVQITTGGQLSLTRTSNIYRQVNLSGKSWALLTFDYSTSNSLENADTTDVEVASSPSGPWTSVLSFVNDQAGSVSYYIPSSLFSATTTVRFRTGSHTSGGENSYFDNVDITFPSGTVTNAGHNPPNFVIAGDGYSLGPNETLTLTYNVIVDSPLATGIDQITNTAYVNSNEITLPLSASVTNLVVNPSSENAEAGGRVWFDINGNGAIDVGEPGLANVEATLKDRLGASLMTTTTDATGHYLFTGVEAGNGYYIELTPRTIPAGLQQSAPAGHSDNRSNSFNLTAGLSYTDADLGYRAAPGSATVMSIVWSDANSNGSHDAGETGLAGITVQLYRDTNSNGIFEPGTDTLWGTTTTAADGSYLFTGVPASGTEDYFVYVDGTQAKLTDYARTAPSNDPLYINKLSAGDVIQYANFGYHGANTYSIKDRIWFDANGNGSFDSGESGIAIVTADLLDASLNVIATTTTDANGYFTFSGVTGGGADYTIRITDTNAKLANYFGTTTSAIMGRKQVVNLTGNIDYSAIPDFGYGLKNSVLGTVFNDTNSSGTLNSGETGMSGVTVKLYNDANGNGRIDAGNDTVQATLTTDSYGNYIFSGLSNGNYIVSIESPPSGYTYTGTDSDSVTIGQQQAANITANGNALNKNFGYNAAAARSVSGTLWNDTNNNGVKDTGETGIAGVTISLLQGGNIIATATTATYGSYSFNGLPGDTYTVAITDTGGVLSGYIGTYEKTEGTAGPFNGQETVDLSSSSQTGIDFGYVSPAVPTLAVLSSFSAHEQDGQVIVQWETASEHNTLGFYLFRLDPATGEYQSITMGLLPGLLTDPRGGTYTLVDSGATSGIVYRYKLVEVERNGRQITYGPFTIPVTTENEKAINVLRNSSAGSTMKVSSSHPSTYTRKAREQSVLQKALAQARKVTSQSTLKNRESQVAPARGSRIKIPVTKDGLYYMDAGDISAITGINRIRIRSMINRQQIAVSNQGQPVAYLPARNNAGIYFYGTGTDSAYTRDNIYWIDTINGITMKNDERIHLPVSVSPGESFTDNLHIEQDVIPNMSQTNDPSEDYWDWNLIYLSNSYSDSPETFTFSLSGKADTQTTATLQVHLVGGSDSGMDRDHHVVVSLNGQQIGEGWWTGLDTYNLTATFDQSLLSEGENTIEVKGVLDGGIPWSMFLIDSFDLAYGRLYDAAGNKLFFTGDGNKTVTAGGFTIMNPDILLFNITDPRAPKVNVAATVDGSPGNYEISFRPASPDARYLAIATDAAVKVDNAVGVNPSNLRASRNMAHYLIIAPGELVSAAQPLAAYRGLQGMKTMVVNLDDIMNEFNFGISSPEAIRQFLTYAYRNWRKAPGYVLLAGAGTWDYRDNLGAGGNLIPPALVPTSYGLSTSDNHLADVDGDHLPDMAIGRLPVLSPQDLQDVTAKIKTFESTAGNKVILLADRPDDGGNFSSDSEAIAGLFPPGYILEKVYLGEYASADTARPALFNDINGGAVFINYIGHASPDMFSAEGLLTSDDIDALINGSGLPIVTAMTCTSGEFAIPGYPSMSQLMVLKSDGGAAAFWSSTGLSDNSEAGILDREFYNAVFFGNKHTLGDAVLQAFEKYSTSGSMPFMTDIYTILGDPALRLK
jgi:uncharacterized repeat protein (TIGR01451 family)/fimbrial isopeptide formation D2 family protein